MEKLFRPVDAKWGISSPFGASDSNLREGPHKGVDFACPVGSPIRACFDGVILLRKTEDEINKKKTKDGKAKEGNRLGLYNRDYRALYWHLQDFECKLGQKVKRGDIIGWSGKTGNASGPHLHFELRILNSDKAVRPEFEGETYEAA